MGDKRLSAIVSRHSRLRYKKVQIARQACIPVLQWSLVFGRPQGRKHLIRLVLSRCACPAQPDGENK
jgi:hypothetical protein